MGLVTSFQKSEPINQKLMVGSNFNNQLLVEKIQESLTLSLFRRGDGSVFGAVTDTKLHFSYRVSVRDIPQALDSQHLSQALETLQKANLKLEGGSISLSTGLLGGGCFTSKAAQEEKASPIILNPTTWELQATSIEKDSLSNPLLREAINLKNEAQNLDKASNGDFWELEKAIDRLERSKSLVIAAYGVTEHRFIFDLMILKGSIYWTQCSMIRANECYEEAQRIYKAFHDGEEEEYCKISLRIISETDNLRR